MNWLQQRVAKALPELAQTATASAGTTGAAVTTGGNPTAVVAACYEFPIYSHSFVYQEMLGLKEVGFDVRLFCWKRGRESHLHAAFSELSTHLTVLDDTWGRHVRDYQYFRDRVPERVSTLMRRLSISFGKSREELEKDHEVLMAFTFAREVEAADADYIHTYFFYEETFFGFVASYILGVPRGVSCYADHMLADSRFKDYALQFERLDLAVATSRRIRDELLELAGAHHAHKILIKPNGVDGSRFQPRERRFRVTGPIELLSVSRIEPKKGLVHLCELARLLKDAGRRARIHIVGSADPATSGSVAYARTFEASRRELGVDDMFVMHGFQRQERLAPLLARADAFIAPYVEVENGDKDGIPTAILEAMASGLPTICTDAGSITEVIDDGVEGLLVPQRAPAALASAVLRLLDEPGLAADLGRAARRRFQMFFDAKVTEPRLHARIEQVLRRRLSTDGARRAPTLRKQALEMSASILAAQNGPSLEPISRCWGFDRGTPVDRHYIEAFLLARSEDIRGRALELGDDSYTRRFGGDAVASCDVLHHAAGNPHATVVADLSSAPHIASGQYDCIVFTQALHLIYDVRAAVSTLYRILNSDGVLLATFPGITPVRGDAWVDEWYWSFTTASATRLFGDVFGTGNIDVTAHGNVVAATAFLQGLAAHEIDPKALDHLDPEFPVTITVRAVKAGAGGVGHC